MIQPYANNVGVYTRFAARLARSLAPFIFANVSFAVRYIFLSRYRVKFSYTSMADHRPPTCKHALHILRLLAAERTNEWDRVCRRRSSVEIDATHARGCRLI